MDRLCAFCKATLMRRLAEIDISVSPRGLGRTTPETERWSICRVLSTLAHVDRLAFPFKLEKSERPDYIIFLNEKVVIGVEITEVVQQDYIQTLMLPEAQQPGSVVDRSLFRKSTARMNLQERRKIARETSLSGPGWERDAPEMEFAEAVKDRILSKTKKLNEESFGRHNEDWLIVFENLSLPGLKRPVASGYLAIALDDYWDESSFHRVFVETGQSIIEFSKSGIQTHEIYDLW